MMGQWTSNSELNALCNWMARDEREGTTERQRRGTVWWRGHKEGIGVWEGRASTLSCPVVSYHVYRDCAWSWSKWWKKEGEKGVFVFEVHKQSPVHSHPLLPLSDLPFFFFFPFFTQLHRMVRQNCPEHEARTRTHPLPLSNSIVENRKKNPRVPVNKCQAWNKCMDIRVESSAYLFFLQSSKNRGRTHFFFIKKINRPTWSGPMRLYGSFNQPSGHFLYWTMQAAWWVKGGGRDVPKWMRNSGKFFFFPFVRADDDKFGIFSFRRSRVHLFITHNSIHISNHPYNVEYI